MKPLARLGLIALLSGTFLGCGSPPADNHPLVGRQAPVFTTTRLDDTPFDLADHLGRDVVILDFWATWCGPCRRALPVLSEVAAEYQDRGVAFFAVDLGESRDEVRQFLEESKLDLPVVMDDDGSIAEKYQVEAIPQTVIIGRDGIVRFVHIGTKPGLDSRLKHQLDELLSGAPVASRDVKPRTLATVGQ